MQPFQRPPLLRNALSERLIVGFLAAMFCAATGAQAGQDVEAGFEQAAAAIEQLEAEQLRKMLEAAPDLAFETDSHGDTLLNMAARRGEPEAVRILIAAGAAIDGAPNRPIESVLTGLGWRDLGLERVDIPRAVFIDIFRELVVAGAEFDFDTFDLPFVVTAAIYGICSDRSFEKTDVMVVERFPPLRIRKTTFAEHALKILAIVAEEQKTAGPCTAAFLQKIELEEADQVQ